MTKILPVLSLYLLHEYVSFGLSSEAPFLSHVVSCFPLHSLNEESRLDMVSKGRLAKGCGCYEPWGPTGQVLTSSVTQSCGGWSGGKGLGSSKPRHSASQKGWHARTQLSLGNPHLLSPVEPVIVGLALTLTLAAWGSDASSLCADVKENAYRGLRDTGNNRQFVV